MNNNLSPSSSARCKCGRYITIGEEKSKGRIAGQYICPDCAFPKNLTSEEYYEQFNRVENLKKTKAMKKTTWADFIKSAKNGIHYMGSTTEGEHTEKSIKTLLDGVTEKCAHDRRLVGGSSVLLLKMGNGSTSRLTKKGSVFLYKDFFIIQSDGWKSSGEKIKVFTIYQK